MRRKHRAFLASVLIAISLLVSVLPGLPIHAAAPTNPNEKLLDLTLADLGKIKASKSTTYQVDTGLSEYVNYSLDKHIQPGMEYSDLMTLGDLAQTSADDLSINQIDELSKTPVKDYALDAFGQVTNQSIETLAAAVPGLGDLELGAVQPLANLVDSKLRAYGEAKLKEFAAKKIKDLLGDKAIAELPVADIPNLSSLSVDSIPGLADTALNKFAGVEGVPVGEIPGLDQIPLSALGLLQGSPLAKLDVVFGPAESNVINQPISGSIQAGFRYPCQQEKCAHIELSTNGHTGDRWIQGGDPEEGGQMVPGGTGLLGKAFGGKEPTGRMLGPEFKIILMGTNEAAGTAEFGLITRVCHTGLGCTPFMVGPWPILTASEGDTIFLGFETTEEGQGSEVDIPPEIQEQINAIKDQYGIGSSASTASAQEDCIKKVVQGVPASQREAAQAIVPDVLKQAEELKLTDSQTAFAVAFALENADLSQMQPVASKYGHRQVLIASRGDLTTLAGAGPNGRDEYLVPEAAQAWLEMQSAARAAGIYLSLADTHRTFEDQESLWNRQIGRQGSEEAAAKWSAPPGHSEHHTGYALDLGGSGSGGLLSEGDPGAAWVQANSTQYGWEVSFELGNSQGVGFEPWHLRYVNGQSKSALGLVGRASGVDISKIASKLKQFVTSSKSDYFGLAQALSQNDPNGLANRAASYQSILKGCFFGGSCDGGKMQRPSNGVVTSEMGGRVHPLYGVWRLHAGIDVSAGSGAPVVAADCGKTSNVGWESGYGNVVVIDHGNGVFTRYAHLDVQLVKQGQAIKKGQLIAYEGSTGGSTGPHLHFEVRKGGEFGEPQNPRNYVAF
jgi:LAS superfamily LD-carboxypeptidase LdcB